VVTTDRFKKKLLGIAIGERSTLVAEVCCAGDGKRVVRGGEFTYPAGVTPEHPEALGAAFKEFLTREGFSTRRAVLGVPAKSLLLKSHALPPAEPQQASAMLWLRAEADSAPELGEMVSDYAGQPSALGPSTVLLMGLPRRWMDRLQVMSEAAGLIVVAVTPCSTALGGATAQQAGNSRILSVTAERAELAEHDGEQTRFLRHLNSTGASLPTLLAELRRAAATHPMTTGAVNDVSASLLGRRERAAAAATLVLWDDAGLDAAAVEAISAALDLSVVRGDLQSIGCGSEAMAGSGRAAAVAVALTLPTLSGARPAVDFLHPRLAAPKKPNLTRRTAWLTGAAAVVALAALLAYTDLSRLQRHVTSADEELQRLDPVLKTARPFVANMEFVESFHNSHPKYLACLSDLTLAIPEDGQTYITRFHLQSNMRGEITGRCPNNQEVLNLMDRLSAGGRFKDLKRRLEAKGSGPEIAFTVTFTYVPK
jgi:hypothetical protein